MPTPRTGRQGERAQEEGDPAWQLADLALLGPHHATPGPDLTQLCRKLVQIGADLALPGRKLAQIAADLARLSTPGAALGRIRTTFGCDHVLLMDGVRTPIDGRRSLVPDPSLPPPDYALSIAERGLLTAARVAEISPRGTRAPD